jgi:hypothetical protein
MKTCIGMEFKVAFLKSVATPTSALAMEKVENFLYN